ncbi:CRAL-TRIO domain-containing protein [Crepidotus variabilis]|uniref:CRAL-TRIO domain-containing protein n=1 Tax=Crepidotus variabilis TaxID=179855 RepID=A0A9P6EBK5_9AGAR|nr:CRAL-TRIO domain-containing protein [Crepidotus variabilis]
MASPKVTTVSPPPPSPYAEDPRAVLSESEQRMYNEVLAHFTKEDLVYVIPNVERGELDENEKFWLSRECILRYLRASKWKVATAITRLEATLKWRREFGIIDVVTAKHVEPEAVTGKEILFGFDVKGRPSFYMIPSRQNTDEPTRQIQFAFWMIERCIDLMEPGVENIGLLINFADKAKNPSLGVARSVLSILQEHYPERLGLAHIINVPFLVSAFFKVISPFIDPVTREKMKFNPNVIKDKFFEPNQVMKEWWGGDIDFEYVHADYWPSIVNLCEERNKKWRETWKGLGSKIGISEWEYKTHNGSSAKIDVVVNAPQPEEAVKSNTVPPVVATDVVNVAVLAPIAAKGQPDAAVPSHSTSAGGEGHGTSTAVGIGAGAVAGGEAAGGDVSGDSGVAGDAGGDAGGGDGGGDGGGGGGE